MRRPFNAVTKIAPTKGFTLPVFRSQAGDLVLPSLLLTSPVQEKRWYQDISTTLYSIYSGSYKIGQHLHLQG